MTTDQGQAHTKKCPDCGAPMIVRLARRSSSYFYGCSTYPECRATAPLSAEELNRLSVDAAAAGAGVAGGSAQAEYERRAAERQVQVTSHFGNANLSNLVLGMANEPKAMTAWKTGAAGERALASLLERLEADPDRPLRALHDRAVPGTAGNIDHLAVGVGGVFVIDAKLYSGRIRIRTEQEMIEGRMLRTPRLYVGSRDCSALAAGMGWQVDSVREALIGALGEEGGSRIPITPVLCFVAGEFSATDAVTHYAVADGPTVRITSTATLEQMLRDAPITLTEIGVGKVTTLLSMAFPAK